MERSARLGCVVAAVVLALSCAPGASANPKPPEVLHPHFRLVADDIASLAAGGRAVVQDGGTTELGGRYVVLVPKSPAASYAIDEETGRQVTFVAPSGCSSFDLVGGQALFAWCSAVNPGPATFAVHDLGSDSYRTLTLSPQIQRYDSPFCAALPAELGDYWVEFDETCDSEGGSTFPHTYVFENTHTGAYSTLPAWKPGGRIVPNLNAQQLRQTLCPGLHAPVRAATALVVDGRFAIATTASSIDTEHDRIYLERCGTRLHMRIRLEAEFSVVAASSHAIVWEANNGGLLGQFSGVFLPSLRRFSFWFPHHLAVDQVAYALDARRLYVLDDSGRAWAAALQPRPARS
jgi:hypothetical protein